MATPISSRREFLRKSMAAGAAIAAPWIVPARALGRDGAIAPSEKIVLGVIGIGPRCRQDLACILPEPDVRCVAVCDVQAERRAIAKDLVDEAYGNRDCHALMDMRELLARPDIDAVLIATGDRWHAHASMMAARAGKDVYSEKPCGLTMAWCGQLADTIQRYGRVFQAGTQRRSNVNFQVAVDLAQSGKLGKIHTMHASVYTPKNDYSWLPAEPEPPREVVDWDTWLGPAPWRPYNSRYCQGRWRGYDDFDSGATLLDWGAHTLDLCQWANRADDTMPLEYEPAADRITCRYANGVTLILDFLKEPFGDRSPQYKTELGTCPVRYEGDEGWVETGDSGDIAVSSEALRQDLRRMFAAKKLEGIDASNHARNFFDCVRSRALTAAHPGVMRHSHVACHAAAIAWLLNRKLKFDPAAESFINDDEANRLRSRAARAPFCV